MTIVAEGAGGGVRSSPWAEAERLQREATKGREDAKVTQSYHRYLLGGSLEALIFMLRATSTTASSKDGMGQTCLVEFQGFCGKFRVKSMSSFGVLTCTQRAPGNCSGGSMSFDFLRCKQVGSSKISRI